MEKLPLLYGCSKEGTEQVISLWIDGNKDKAAELLMMCISVNRPETKRNTKQMAIETIEKYIETNFN